MDLRSGFEECYHQGWKSTSAAMTFYATNLSFHRNRESIRSLKVWRIRLVLPQRKEELYGTIMLNTTSDTTKR